MRSIIPRRSKVWKGSREVLNCEVKMLNGLEEEKRRRAGSSCLVSVIFPSSKSQRTTMYTSLYNIRCIVAENSENTLYFSFNENNMQSVKCNLGKIEYDIKAKDSITKDNNNNNNDDCLISNISLIIIIIRCVPQLMISSKYTYSKDYYKTMTTDTKNLGALPTFWNLESQNISKDIIDKCDSNIIILRCILINQILGHTPDDSIPELKNAINVQGIKFGEPHSHSFNKNLMYNHTSGASAPFIFNKSDYVFIPRHITLLLLHCESDTLGVREKERVQTTNRNSELLTQIPNDKAHTQGSRVSKTIISTKPSDYFNKFANGDYTFASLLKMVEEAPMVMKKVLAAGTSVKTWGIPAMLQLAGGGENSLNTPTGWASPPSATNTNGNNSSWGNNAAGGPSGNSQQWVTNNQRPPTSQSDGNSNKINNASGNNGSNIAPPTSGGNSSTNNWGGAAQAQQPQQSQSQANNGSGSPGGANSGGGSTPGSGAPSTPPQATATAKSQLEQLNTMRESLFSLDGWGGQHVNQDTNWDVPNSPEPGVKMDQQGGGGGGGPPMWKPNINNGTDLWEANLRNGGQPPPQPVAKTPWGHTPTTNIGGTWGEDDDAQESNNVWNGPPPPQQWGGPPQQPPHWNASAKKDDWGGWGEPHRPELHRPDLHRAPAPDPRDMRTLMGDMRGDPRGISGRLNGSNDMWGQHHMQHGMQPPNKMMGNNGGNGVNQWGTQGPKDIGLSKGTSGWEEPSPPAARRNMANFDDGTSLWGQQRGGNVGMGPWKDMAGGMGRGAMPCPPGMPPNRLPGVAPNPMKPDSMWGQHPHRNGSWDDPAGHNATNWEKDNVNSWNETPMNPSAAGWPGPNKTKPISGPGGSWDADMGDWCGPKPPVGGPPAKLLPKDVVWNSKQFRVLADMGYKKEDVEQALRNRDMNADEALDFLSQMRGNSGGIDSWRRHDEHQGGPPFDHQQQYPAAPPRPHHSFPPQQPPSSTLQFAQPSSINNMSPAMVQKMINPTNQPQQQFNQQNNQSGGGSQPTTAQLRMLVQQIQMAVSAGYLNHQILNQPLAPQTLLLLNQLLQQIKHLQKQASQQSMMQNNMTVGKNNSAFLQLSYQITKTKQQIASLQNQITAQQTIYVQQQASGGGTGSGNGGPSSGSSGDFFNKQHDPLVQLQNNFADITLSKEPPSGYGGAGGQQSRLNQWKLPSVVDKDVEGSEFSRAPGTTSKSATSPQLNPIVLQPDNTWSSGVRGPGVNDGWPSADTSDLPDGKDTWSSSQQHSAAASSISDLIPEFEPGKPWKGNQMKNIEDDPAITPGSVARSPLSLAAIKEPDSVGVVGGKVSPSTPSLTSSTWTYPPPPASTPSSLGLTKGGDALWGSKPTTTGGRLQTSKPSASTSGPNNAWAAPAPPRNQPYHQSWPSTWLLLKNLTPQIEGSTLRTLCVQHGPLLSFHLYLNQSIALARYGTREEANKAQTALNNCVLGNTTIFAESPGETDVRLILQHLGQGGGGGQWRSGSGAGGSTPGDSGSTNEWSIPALWSEPDQRATPSSLSFLPPDLLGGESM